MDKQKKCWLAFCGDEYVIGYFWSDSINQAKKAASDFNFYNFVSDMTEGETYLCTRALRAQILDDKPHLFKTKTSENEALYLDVSKISDKDFKELNKLGLVGLREETDVGYKYHKLTLDFNINDCKSNNLENVYYSSKKEVK